MTGPMIPRERCDFSAIVDRPPLKLPNGARIVFWTIVNYEVWDIARPMARQVLPAPTGVPLLPDVPNWSWHEYGMRVGAWRFYDLFARLGIRPTLAANARICEDYPRVAEQAKRDGWEFMGHAYDQMPIHKHDDQAAMIDRSMDILERFTGKRPVGWLGPGLTQTLETPEHLVAAGVKYIGDWVYDDEPTTIRTANGPLVTLPYSVELNDIPMMIVQHHESDYLLAARDRSVRPALRRGQGPRQDHGARDPSLHQRPAAPDQIPRGDLRLREPLRGRAALERRADSRLVFVGRGRRQGRRGGRMMLPTLQQEIDRQLPINDEVFLDHVGYFVADLEAAGRRLERLGFAVSPINLQQNADATGVLRPSGTSNRLAVLRRGFIEILAATHEAPLADQLRKAVARYEGLHLIALSHADIPRERERLMSAGFKMQEVVRLRRHKQTPDGVREVAWSVLRPEPGVMPEGRVQFAYCHTPDLTWTPDAPAPENGADTLTDILLCVKDRQRGRGALCALCRRGRKTERDERSVIALDRGRIVVVEPKGAAAMLPSFAATGHCRSWPGRRCAARTSR